MKRSYFKRKPRANKFGAKKTLKDGIVFDSMLEAREYADLKLLEKAGEIRDLELQYDITLKVNEKQICTYIADFFYFDVSEDKYVISDAKGILTDVFKLKWRLCKSLYPDFIYELRKQGKIIRE